MDVFVCGGVGHKGSGEEISLLLSLECVCVWECVPVYVWVCISI